MRLTIPALIVAAGLSAFGSAAQAAPISSAAGIAAPQSDVTQAQWSGRERRTYRHYRHWEHRRRLHDRRVERRWMHHERARRRAYHHRYGY